MPNRPRPAGLIVAASAAALLTGAAYQGWTAERARVAADPPARAKRPKTACKQVGRKTPMPQPTPPGRRTHLAAMGAVVSLAAVVGCQGQGQGGCPSLFGYKLGAGALYDPNIKTVYVPMFYNRALQTTPYRGMEVEITKAVVREIGTKTKFKVVSDPDRADTELRGVVVTIGKNILNRNLQNLTREEEVVITADVIWRDLRDGRNLSAPRKGNNPIQGPVPDPVAFDPTVPLPPPPGPDPSFATVRIVAAGRVLPELGESVTTGEQKAINQLAVQIVSMMEKPW